MNSEKILWNVYLNINCMDKLERDFYDLYYDYKRLLYNKNKQANFNSNVRKVLLTKLNKAYEKIHDCSDEEKNSNGEYDYPKVAYKLRSTKVNGKTIATKYVSVDGTNSCRTIDIGHMFDYIPLYVNGELKVKNIGSKDDIEHLALEMPIKDVILFFKNNIEAFSKGLNSEIVFDALSKLSDFPVDSITELDFNGLVLKEDIDIIKADFLKIIETECKQLVEISS